MMHLSARKYRSGVAIVSGPARPARSGIALRHRSHSVVAFFGKKKSDKAGDEKNNKDRKKMTLGELAAENSKKGWKSSSGGSAGFASKSKAYIEVQETEAYVDEDADFMGKLMGMFSGGKKK